jgi:hypothetical protein
LRSEEYREAMKRRIDEYREGLEREATQSLRAQLKQDDERLRVAAERAKVGWFGCDTAEHLADEIEALRAQLEAAQGRVKELEALQVQALDIMKRLQEVASAEPAKPGETASLTCHPHQVVAGLPFALTLSLSGRDFILVCEEGVAKSTTFKLYEGKPSLKPLATCRVTVERTQAQIFNLGK